MASLREDPKSRARVFREQLPNDEESPDRALSFQALIRSSNSEQDAATLVVELYESAAAGDWGWSLHDTLMLLSAIDLNPRLKKKLRFRLFEIRARTSLNIHL